MTSRSTPAPHLSRLATVTAFPQARMTAALFTVLVVVALAAGLSGYDQGVRSGALSDILQDFSFSLPLVRLVARWTTLGVVLGALVAGALADRLGRKDTASIAAALLTLGAATPFFVAGVETLATGRLMMGIGVGMAAVVAPLYAAEMAPQRLRGRFVCFWQLAMTAGLLTGCAVDEQLALGASWRLIQSVAALPGLAFLAVALFAPESPRWLIGQDRRQYAEMETRRLEPAINAKTRIGTITKSYEADPSKPSFRELFRSPWRRPLQIALGLAFLQQIPGISAMVYFANSGAGGVGVATSSAQAGSTMWAIGAVSLAAAVVAIVLVDRIGRRKLLLAGLIGMTASLVALSIVSVGASSTETSSAGAVAMVVFMGSFGFSLGPIAWVVISEVFPAHLRSRGVALATAVNGGLAYVAGPSFRVLVDGIGSSLAYGVLAGSCVIAWFWIYRNVPETKGESLEQIQEKWTAIPNIVRGAPAR